MAQQCNKKIRIFNVLGIHENWGIVFITSVKYIWYSPNPSSVAKKVHLLKCRLLKSSAACKCLCQELISAYRQTQQTTHIRQHLVTITVVPTKSDSDDIFCLQLLCKTLTCTLHLRLRESVYHLGIHPILGIGLIHK